MANGSVNTQAPSVAANKSIDTLGFLTWWEFQNLKITPNDLRKILDNHSLNINVPDIDKKSALLQCIREYRFQTNKKRYKAELAMQETDYIVLNLLERKKITKKSVEWHHVETITYDSFNSSFLDKGTNIDPDVVEARKCFHNLFEVRSKFLDHNFVRPNILQKTLNEINAISLRNRGGVYFVDYSSKDRIERLNNFLNDIDGVVLCVCTMNSDKTTKNSLSNQVRSTFIEKLKDLESRTSVWKNRTRNLRKDTMKETLEEFAEIRNSLEIYQQSLKMKADDLLQSLTEIEDIANSVVLDQAGKSRGISGSSIKRWKQIFEKFGGQNLEEYIIATKDLEFMNLPECYSSERFYDAKSNSSGYRALIHLGYIANLQNETLTITKI